MKYLIVLLVAFVALANTSCTCSKQESTETDSLMEGTPDTTEELPGEASEEAPMDAEPAPDDTDLPMDGTGDPE